MTALVSDFVTYGLVFGIPVGAGLAVLLWSVKQGKRD